MVEGNARSWDPVGLAVKIPEQPKLVPSYLSARQSARAHQTILRRKERKAQAHQIRKSLRGVWPPKLPTNVFVARVNRLVDKVTGGAAIFLSGNCA